MYCDTYCKGKNFAVDCKKYSGSEKEKCIKSCLDCRSPSKKYCYCPEIFPPKLDKVRSLRVRSLADDDIELNGMKLNESTFTMTYDENRDDGDDTVFTVCVIVSVFLVIIGVSIFCYMRYKRWRKSNNKVETLSKSIQTVKEGDQAGMKMGMESSEPMDNKKSEPQEDEGDQLKK